MRIEFVLPAFENPLASTEIGKNQLFAEGDVEDLPQAWADRWIRRGIAVRAVDKPAAKKTAKKKRTK